MSHAVGYAAAAQVSFDGGGLIARPALIKIYGHQFIIDGHAPLVQPEEIQQGVAIFSSRDADQHPIAFFDEIPGAHGLSELAHDAHLDLRRKAKSSSRRAD